MTLSAKSCPLGAGDRFGLRHYVTAYQVGILLDQAAARGDAGERIRNSQRGDIEQCMMAELQRLGYRGIGKDSGLNAITLQRRDHGFHAADLDDSNVFFGQRPKCLQRQARPDVDRSAEPGDANGSPFKCSDFSIPDG